MLYKKPANLKYTDLCIWVDANMDKIYPAGTDPAIENQVWNYLWLILKAIAIKKQMFENYADYDGFSFYGATRIFTALRNNLKNRGHVVKGKEIKPIKSCLNYMKALLHPMKLEYLHQEYETKLSTAIVNQQFDTMRWKEKIAESMNDAAGMTNQFNLEIRDTMTSIGSLLDEVLAKSPFDRKSVDYKRLKISVMMNMLENLKKKKTLSFEPQTIIVWKMPKSTSAYVKVFIKSVGSKLKREIIESYESCKVPDNVVSYIMTNPDGEYIDNED